MQDETAVLPAPKRTARNKGKLIGAKPPLLAKHVGSIRTKLQSRYHQRRWIQSFAKCKPARLWVLLLLLRSGDRGDDWGVTPRNIHKFSLYKTLVGKSTLSPWTSGEVLDFSTQRRVLLSLGYGCGLRASEIVRLKVKHIDSAQKMIRIEQSKGRKDRNVMLSDEMLRLLRQWWKARPSRYDAGIPLQERWLFPSRKSAAGRSPLAIFRILRCPGGQR